MNSERFRQYILFQNKQKLSFILTKLYLDVADAYIKLSSGFNTLSTSDKTDLSK